MQQEIVLKSMQSADWEAFLGRHDMLWSPHPSSWESGAFIGNGLLGAMIYSLSDQELQWDIGRSDVTERQPTNTPIYGKHRLPIGKLLLKTVGRVVDSGVRVHLWNAEAAGFTQTEAGRIEWRSFVHADQHAIVVEWSATGGESSCQWSFVPERPINPRQVHRKEPITDINPPHITECVDGIEIVTQKLQAGGEFATAWKTTATGAGTNVLLLSVGSSYPENGGREEALQAIIKADKTGIAELTASHRAWWHHYYPESFLSIPDTRLESLYWIQMYKLASGTRADRPLLDLMGPWFYIDTPWPAIWWNLNVQLTYWPVYASNRLHLGESLTRFLEHNLDSLIGNVPEEYRHDSAAIGRSSSYDGVRNAGEELGNLPWICHNYWLHYRHCMDESMLRDRIYPLLRRSINFYLHLLQPGADEKLHLPLAISPEYPDKAEDTNYDLSLLRWGCQTLLYICDRLNLEDALKPRWEEVLDRLADYPVDDTGFMIGKDVPLSVSHRHYSHLFMIYPLYLISWEQPEHRDIIWKSLQHWIGFKGALQGYSYTGASSIYSSMGKAEEAVQCLNDFMKQYLKPNTMYMESGPVIETPLSAAASIHDLMLQSWGDKIRIFPAIPAHWHDVTFHGLRAEGGFLVSAVKQEGATRFILIHSEAGEPCRIQTDIAGPVACSGSRAFTLTSNEDGSIQIDLNKGEFVIIYPEGSEPDLAFVPVPANPDRLNSFGSRQ
ncbi:alpha-L-fucosidase [Paenibacillus sp. H1-7]|uniref:glycosyl hydrolase family 95 catalytic domain-containing protein n=1 Tax=Paenibacillus sp. H1-7 TaxID=2282849 RepID=UPI0031F31474|nr:alpha-L-fucosidase [Paenibacillus sp. H1-7]